MNDLIHAILVNGAYCQLHGNLHVPDKLLVPNQENKTNPLISMLLPLTEGNPKGFAIWEDREGKLNLISVEGEFKLDSQEPVFAQWIISDLKYNHLAACNNENFVAKANHNYLKTMSVVNGRVNSKYIVEEPYAKGSQDE